MKNRFALLQCATDIDRLFGDGYHHRCIGVAIRSEAYKRLLETGSKPLMIVRMFAGTNIAIFYKPRKRSG